MTGSGMSQERTRFPIHPKDVHRSAQSNGVPLAATKTKKSGKRKQADKPIVPPHKRNDGDAGNPKR
jgi:hypothetical protein